MVGRIHCADEEPLVVWYSKVLFENLRPFVCKARRDCGEVTVYVRVEPALVACVTSLL